MKWTGYCLICPCKSPPPPSPSPSILFSSPSWNGYCKSLPPPSPYPSCLEVFDLANPYRCNISQISIFLNFISYIYFNIFKNVLIAIDIFRNSYIHVGIDISILQIVFINIDIDRFKNVLIDIDIFNILSISIFSKEVPIYYQCLKMPIYRQSILIFNHKASTNLKSAELNGCSSQSVF